jgi:hypothetical protein
LDSSTLARDDLWNKPNREASLPLLICLTGTKMSLLLMQRPMRFTH